MVCRDFGFAHAARACVAATRKCQLSMASTSMDFAMATNDVDLTNATRLVNNNFMATAQLKVFPFFFSIIRGETGYTHSLSPKMPPKTTH